jgi:hypothetical protein
VASVRKRTIPTERPPLVREDSANFLADRGCHVVSATISYARFLGFIDRNRYYFFQVAPRLYSRGWVDPVPDSLLFCCSARDRTRDLRISSQELWPLDYRGGQRTINANIKQIIIVRLLSSTIHSRVRCLLLYNRKIKIFATAMSFFTQKGKALCFF